MTKIDVESLIFLEQWEQKPFYGHYTHYILTDTHQKYIMAVAKTELTKHYLKNSVKYQPALEKSMAGHFEFNPILQHGELSKGNKYNAKYYALYPYLEDAERVSRDDFTPIEKIQKYYDEKAVEYEVTEELADKIIENILDYYIEKDRKLVYEHRDFNKLKNELLKMKTVKIADEHNDYSCTNTLKRHGKYYLIDFEASRLFQPIGFDILNYYFYCYLGHRDLDTKIEQIKNEIPNYEFNKLRFDKFNMRYVHLRAPTLEYFDDYILIKEDENTTKVNITLTKKLVVLKFDKDNAPAPYSTLCIINHFKEKYPKLKIKLIDCKDYFKGLQLVDKNNLVFSGVLRAVPIKNRLKKYAKTGVKQSIKLTIKGVLSLILSIMYNIYKRIKK